MQNQSFIPGKDASLESSITTLRGVLAERGFDVEEASWLNPVDAVWSVHLRDRDCPLMFSNGKGASELAARASALGEFVERVNSRHFWTHYYLGRTRAQGAVVHDARERWFPIDEDGAWPEGLLDETLRAHYDPDEGIDAAMLVDLNSGNRERGICALPFTRLTDDETVWMPVNIVGNLFLSNGIAAGNTLFEARAQALSEVLERHVKYRVIAENLCLPDVPEAVLARYPATVAGIAGLRAAGFGIVVKDASLGGQFPVMCVALLNPKDQGLYASFGAHPNVAVALERALTELLQGRALDALDGFPPPAFDSDEVGSPANLEIHFVDSSGLIGWEFLRETPDFAFADWNFAGTTQTEYEWLCACIASCGKDIYALDYSHLNAYTCRMLVPGMSEVYPVEDLEWENNSIGIALRDAVVDLHALDEAACTRLLDDLQSSDLADERPLWELIGLAMPDSDPWKQLRVGELKTLLALAIGDAETALEGCEWLDHFNDLPPARLAVYRCTRALLELAERGDFTPALVSLYGAEAVRQAQALVSQDERFFGLCRLGHDFEGSALHQKLLRAHDKLGLVR
ncbi:MAG: 30S ribosomal protein S12 methylthiotransferase accessory factor YcaO [Rhodocyclaceae bacterium]